MIFIFYATVNIFVPLAFVRGYFLRLKKWDS